VIDGKFTTAEAAKKIGIHQITLQKWIAAGKVEAPKPVLVGAVGCRLWTRRDIARVVKVKRAIYRKGRGRKRGPKFERDVRVLSTPTRP
jgi:excisionase family DNA binding protein